MNKFTFSIDLFLFHVLNNYHYNPNKFKILLNPLPSDYKAYNISQDQMVSKNLDFIFLSFATHKTNKDQTALLSMASPHVLRY
jgi:hypothetical protein